MPNIHIKRYLLQKLLPGHKSHTGQTALPRTLKSDGRTIFQTAFEVISRMEKSCDKKWSIQD